MSLTEFLLARITEDEAFNGCPGEGEYSACWRRSDRIEKECEAKRRIVEAYQWRVAQDADEDDRDSRLVTTTRCEELETVLHNLALPYADHPDYDESWRP